MTTRLITTYDEAKALKEAGWPQRLTFHGCRYEEIVQGKHKLQPSTSYSRPLYANEIAAARLDELLAFLWDGAWHPSVEQYDHPDEDSGEWGCVTDIPGDSAHIVTHTADAPIAAVVKAVLYILNSERSPE